MSDNFQITKPRRRRKPTIRDAEWRVTMIFLTNRRLTLTRARQRTFTAGSALHWRCHSSNPYCPQQSATTAAKKLTPTALRQRLRAARRGAGLLDPESTAGLIPVHLRAAGTVPQNADEVTSRMWSQSSGESTGVTGADHFVASAYLSGVKPRKTTNADIKQAPRSISLIMQKIALGRALPSCWLISEIWRKNSTNCGEGYSCVYTNTHLVADADPATADGDQSAGRVRAHVRRRQLAGAARPGANARPACSTP